jgi:cytochrome c oxidase cbb3-type subunit 1
VLYIAALWVNGIMQGLMWRAYNQDGTLTYAFVESVEASYPGWIVRVLGGAIFLGGMLIMAYNVFMTIRKESPGPGRRPRRKEQRDHGIVKHERVEKASAC